MIFAVLKYITFKYSKLPVSNKSTTIYTEESMFSNPPCQFSFQKFFPSRSNVYQGLSRKHAEMCSCALTGLKVSREITQ